MKKRETIEDETAVKEVPEGIFIAYMKGNHLLPQVSHAFHIYMGMESLSICVQNVALYEQIANSFLNEQQVTFLFGNMKNAHTKNNIVRDVTDEDIRNHWRIVARHNVDKIRGVANAISISVECYGLEALKNREVMRVIEGVYACGVKTLESQAGKQLIREWKAFLHGKTRAEIELVVHGRITKPLRQLFLEQAEKDLSYLSIEVRKDVALTLFSPHM